ncbi:MAG: hypothetical protein HYZ92_00805 [Candidatus Omnitrophica bacterium]|nr:hypothetical protein [Candidatus Omnitrophota bacterium]
MAVAAPSKSSGQRVASHAVSGTLKLRAGTVPGEVRGEREVSSSAARHAGARQRCREPHASQALLPRATRPIPGGFSTEQTAAL